MRAILEFFFVFGDILMVLLTMEEGSSRLGPFVLWLSALIFLALVFILGIEQGKNEYKGEYIAKYPSERKPYWNDLSRAEYGADK